MKLPRPVEQWASVLPGLEKKTGPGVLRGPWFQYHDAVGFEWNTYRVSLPDLPKELDGFRIVQLSDLHCQPHWQTAYDELVDRLNADPPDLLVITGDIVDFIRRPQRCLPTATRLINMLRAPRRVIGIFGNHDLNVPPTVYDNSPLQLMDGNRIVICENGQSSVELIASPGIEREDYPEGFENTLPEKEQGIPRIILSHYPDHIRRLSKAKPDLFLCGHTHGGQVCLPGRIPLLKHDSLPHHMWHGVHQYEKTWLFVNRGFGFSTLPFRVFCPSEVIEIRLKSNA